jgi:hypothetical protein
MQISVSTTGGSETILYNIDCGGFAVTAFSNVAAVKPHHRCSKTQRLYVNVVDARGLQAATDIAGLHWQVLL